MRDIFYLCLLILSIVAFFYSHTKLYKKYAVLQEQYNQLQLENSQLKQDLLNLIEMNADCIQWQEQMNSLLKQKI